LKDKGPRHLPRISATRLTVVIAAVAVVYFLVAGAFNTVRSHQWRQQESQLRSEIQDLQSRYQRLEALKEYLNSDEYIETVAREQLGLVRPGEIGFVVVSTAATPTPAPSDEGPELWWDLLIR